MPEDNSNPELEALTLLTTETNDKLAGIEAASEASAQQLLNLEDIAQNQETQLVQADENTQKLVKPLEKIAKNTEIVSETLKDNVESISKMAAFLSEMKGDKGDKGDTGEKGDKGVSGEKGDTGADSTVAGPKGDKGDVGPQGPVGKQGFTGLKGDNGDQGDKGDRGEKGDKGEDADTNAVIETVTKTLSKQLAQDTDLIARKVGSKTYAISELSDTQTATVDQIMVKQADGSWAPENQTGGGGGGHTIEDEGTPLTQRTNLNFVGAGVTVTDDAGNDATLVTIPGGGSGAPGGSDTQIQFNDGGSFGGDADFTWNDGSQILTIGDAVNGTIQAGNHLFLYAGGNGGMATLRGADGTGASNAGDMNLAAGSAGTGGNGGSVYFASGNGGSAAGNAGDIVFFLGTAAAGSPGNFRFYAADTAFVAGAILDFDNIATTDKTFTFPNATGTIALTAQADDIEITDTTKGIILKSADGTRWRIGITNGGELTAVSL